jgi:hypothetical protein
MSFNNNIIDDIIKIQRQWKRYYVRKILKIDKDTLNSYISLKYRKKDPYLMKYIIEINKKNDSLSKENIDLRHKINELSIKIAKSGKNIFNNISVPSLNLSNSIINTNNFNNTFSILNTSSRNDIDLQISKRDDNSFKENFNNVEINNLKKKVLSSKKKYNELFNIASEYEKKMNNFVKLINTNPEIKNVLSKYGVQFN